MADEYELQKGLRSERIDNDKSRGSKGTFILQHSATMMKGEGQLTITVVPDSGTDEVAGISGKLGIKIENGKHSYDFEYAVK